MPAGRVEAIADNSEVIRQLNKRVEELEARLKEIETKQASAASSPKIADAHVAEPASNGIEEEADETETKVDGLPNETPSLRINGFADLKYQASDLKGNTNSFELGQMDLFITSRLSDKLSVLAEMVVEAGDDNKVGLDLERLLLQYSPNDRLNLNFGRYHTAIGYHNTTYHHGAWFQTAIDRPFIFAFEDEGGILPIHNVGLSANGRIPSGSLGLHYVAEVGNGRTSRSRFDEQVQNVLDENNGKAVNLGLFARPNWVPGLQAGVSIYRDMLAPEGLPRIRQTIIAGHLVYQGRNLELLNEVVVVHHALRGSQRVFNTFGFYSQAARKFGNVQPYARYQYLNAPDDEPIFSDVSRRNGPSFGLRYDFNEFAAIKMQYDYTSRRRSQAINNLGLQLSFTF